MWTNPESVISATTVETEATKLAVVCIQFILVKFESTIAFGHVFIHFQGICCCVNFFSYLFKMQLRDAYIVVVVAFIPNVTGIQVGVFKKKKK